MSETLTQLQPASQDILNLAAMSLCAAPDLTEAERANRSQTVIGGTMAFLPTDTEQTIIGTLVMGHYLAIMDGFRDIARLKLAPAEAARARMVTVSQTKLLLRMLHETRAARKEAPAPKTVAAPAPKPGGEGGFKAIMAQFEAANAKLLAKMAGTDNLTAAGAMERDALCQAAPALFAAPGEDRVPEPVTGSRAQRRAAMKRNGAFKRK